ncbi:MAG: metallophosphoesterase [Polyangiaceae bacterium]|nr:metallophosphoesterase [Polyangiaceae bacterium]
MGIINQINAAFIEHGAEFVIQVGDLVDKETDSPNGNSSNRMDTRAAAAQALYDAGIGFFPLRGNHEGSATAAAELPVLFPQTTGTGPQVGRATNFTSPSDLLAGLSYSFDYKNPRFVLLDQFTRPDNSNYLGSMNNNIVDQLDWIDAQLSSKGSDRHGFLFSHKNLMGANHIDMLFGSDPSTNPEAQDTYFESLFNNGVRYHFGGHDHNHTRSLVTSPNGEFLSTCTSPTRPKWSPATPPPQIEPSSRAGTRGRASVLRRHGRGSDRERRPTEACRPGWPRTAGLAETR